MSKLKQLSSSLTRWLLPVATAGVGYTLGQQKSNHSFQQPDFWDQKSTQFAFETAIKNSLRWKDLPEKLARNTLPPHLDAAKIPHSDLVVPSETPHSKRYTISQWQRSATGAVDFIFSMNTANELCIALGPQRGKLRVPQGYMEVPLPPADLTGLRAQGASRINSSTGQAVPADASLLQTAAREVKEEIGLDIPESDFHLLTIKHLNPLTPTVEAIYTAIVPGLPPLRTLDTEFPDDDMKNPSWVRLRDLERNKDGKWYYKAIEVDDAASIQQSIKALQKEGKIQPSQLEGCKAFLAHSFLKEKNPHIPSFVS
jgi:8-oxo-dGTP pyrophosphatase MutT (NUDIX family)